MKSAIKELNNVIKYYENFLEEQLEFINSDKFKNVTMEGSVEFATEHTKRIIGDYINELQRAVAILETISNMEKESLKVDKVMEDQK